MRSEEYVMQERTHSNNSLRTECRAIISRTRDGLVTAEE